jgi:hypothetical protein
MGLANAQVILNLKDDSIINSEEGFSEAFLVLPQGI